MSTMGYCDDRRRRTVDRRLWGHASTGPSGVRLQSVARPRARISPRPANRRSSKAAREQADSDTARLSDGGWQGCERYTRKKPTFLSELGACQAKITIRFADRRDTAERLEPKRRFHEIVKCEATDSALDRGLVDF